MRVGCPDEDLGPAIRTFRQNEEEKSRFPHIFWQKWCHVKVECLWTSWYICIVQEVNKRWYKTSIVLNCWLVVLLTCAYEIGDTTIYFIHASNLTKNLSNIIKMCYFYFKIVVFYENGQIYKKQSIFYKKKTVWIL